MMEVICFHNPNEENGYLSNWYPSPFTLDGVTFSSMEQYMMYRKALCSAVLAECAVKDRIWGIGLSMQDPDRLERTKWRGENLLGYALMMVRERLG